jgi:hypothetical protein
VRQIDTSRQAAAVLAEVKISDRQRRVLIDMLNSGPRPEWGVFFRSIARRDEDIPETRRIVRALARKGLAVFMPGLFDHDGRVTGSGYGLTKEGVARAEAEQAKALSAAAENGCGNG